VGGLAASYVDVSLRADPADVAVMVAGLAAITTLASAWVARGAAREPIAEALRDT
jgi:hypothetical protein